MGPHPGRSLLASRAVRWSAAGLCSGVLVLVYAGVGRGAPPSEYLGAEACGVCHAAAFEAWSNGPHARAMDSLTPSQGADPMCRSCHTLTPDRDEPALAGVQCEACHGAGRKYAPENVMRDPVLAKLLGLEPIQASTCLACHRPESPSVEAFDFVTAVQRVCVNRGARRAQPPSNSP